MTVLIIILVISILLNGFLLYKMFFCSEKRENDALEAEVEALKVQAEIYIKELNELKGRRKEANEKVNYIDDPGDLDRAMRGLHL